MPRRGGGVQDDAVALTGSRVWQSVVETALKINPSLCVSSPPAWAQPFTAREKAFMHQARAYFPVSVQPDKLKMLATRPLERQVFMESFRTAQLNFWKQCHPLYLDLLEVPAVIKKILRRNWGHHKPKDPEKRAGGGSKLCTTAPEIEHLRFNKERRRLQKDDAHLQVFFQLHQARTWKFLIC